MKKYGIEIVVGRNHRVAITGDNRWHLFTVEFLVWLVQMNGVERKTILCVGCH